eukprot:12276946-Ditylum_brightwellii.AAC.1
MKEMDRNGITMEEGITSSEEEAQGLEDEIDKLKHMAQQVKANMRIGHGFYNKMEHYKNKPEQFFIKKNKVKKLSPISHNICGGISGGDTPKL